MRDTAGRSLLRPQLVTPEAGGGRRHRDQPDGRNIDLAPIGDFSGIGQHTSLRPGVAFRDDNHIGRDERRSNTPCELDHIVAPDDRADNTGRSRVEPSLHVAFDTAIIGRIIACNPFTTYDRDNTSTQQRPVGARSDHQRIGAYGVRNDSRKGGNNDVRHIGPPRADSGRNM